MCKYMTYIRATAIFILTMLPLLASAADNSAFVSQNVQPSMGGGQTYNVSVSMKNIGTTTWTQSKSYRLGSQGPSNNSTWGLSRINVPQDIAPNQSVTFNFTVTAPSTPANYNFQWQMVQEGIDWFGPISPATSIVVKQASAADNAAFVSQNVQPIMGVGQSYNVSVSMKNIGTTTWTQSKSYRLGSQGPSDNSTWGLSRINVPQDIAPNQSATFNFIVIAPSNPANYNFQWQMVQEGIDWFGPVSPAKSVAVTGTKRGGSNFNFYNVGSDGVDCDWYPFFGPLESLGSG